MIQNLIRTVLFAVLVLAAVCVPCAGLVARSKAPGCEAVFSVICEDGCDVDVEFTITEVETGKTVKVFVGKLDGYRKTVSIPPGIYTASACIPDPEKGFEVFVDESQQKAESGGTCCFCAVAGSWMYTEEYAGSEWIRDESSGPAYIGTVWSGDVCTDGTGREESLQGSGQDVEDTSAEAGAAPAVPEIINEQGEEIGKAVAGRIIIAALGMLVVIIGGAMSFRRNRR